MPATYGEGNYGDDQWGGLMSNECRSSIQVCATRVARLDGSGGIIAGANNLYVSDALITIDFDPEVSAGIDLEQKNGCDSVCVSVRRQDRVKRLKLTMELCQLDAELLELLTGGTVMTIGGVSRGFFTRGITQAEAPGVCMELWSVRQNGSVADVTRPYWRFGLPRTKWRVGKVTLANDILRVPLEGFCDVNSLFANGPANDWPSNMPSDCVLGWFADTGLPSSQCGYSVTPAQSGS